MMLAAEELVSEEHFLAAELHDKMAALRARAALLQNTWARRHTVYEQHHDTLLFKRDAELLNNWISTRYHNIPLFISCTQSSNDETSVLVI